MLSAFRRGSPSVQGPWLTKLGTLISLVKQHIRGFMDPILSIVNDFWDHPSLQTVVIQLVEVMARALEGEFKAFLPRILRQILGTFDGELADPHRHGVLVEMLHALAAFGLSLEEYIHLVLPAVLKLFDRPEVGFKVREAAIVTIGTLARKVNFAEHASQIIHSLARVVGAATPSQAQPAQQQLAAAAMNTLCHLVVQLGSDYAIFIPMMSKVFPLLRRKRKMHSLTQLLSGPDGQRRPTCQLRAAGRQDSEERETAARLRSPELVRLRPPPLRRQPCHLLTGSSHSDGAEAANTATPGNVAVNQQALKQVWDTSLVSTADEWRDWSKQLGLELLHASPSVALRACQDLAQE